MTTIDPNAPKPRRRATVRGRPPLVSSPMSRARLMRDMLLTLMLAYFRPVGLSGWVEFDIGTFAISVMLPDPFNEGRMRMIAFDQFRDVVLDIQWDDLDNAQLRSYVPGAWEVDVPNINFWTGKARWRLNPGTTALHDFGRSDHDGAALPHLAAQSGKLLSRARAFAQDRMRAHHAAGDRDRGDNWSALLAAMAFEGGPSSSDLLQ